MTELQRRLQELSGTKKDAVGAANAWAGTTGLDLLGALNAKAGTDGLGLNDVIQKMTGGKGEAAAELRKDSSTWNPALGAKVTASAGGLNLERIVDGVSSNTDSWAGAEPGLQNVVVDLGSAQTLSAVKVWHYYGDGRTYNDTKTEVSVDGVTWTAVFDSAVSGTYAEASSGRTHSFTPQSVRYIRDWINGSAGNTYNHWVEIQAVP